MCVCDQLSDYRCNDNVYYMSNNLDDLDYRDDSITIQPSPNEFTLRTILPGNFAAMTDYFFQRSYLQLACIVGDYYAQYTPPPLTRLNCRVVSRRRRHSVHEFATNSRRLPTDSVDKLETDKTDSIAV